MTDGLIFINSNLYLTEQGNYGSSGKIYKLDTNGSNPDMISVMLKEGLLDFIAMDVKTSFSKYCQ